MPECNCEQYRTNITYLRRIFMWAEAYGVFYLGEVFVYCPWCGKELVMQNQVVDEAAE